MPKEISFVGLSGGGKKSLEEMHQRSGDAGGESEKTDREEIKINFRTSGGGLLDRYSGVCNDSRREEPPLKSPSGRVHEWYGVSPMKASIDRRNILLRESKKTRKE